MHCMSDLGVDPLLPYLYSSPSGVKVNGGTLVLVLYLGPSSVATLAPFQYLAYVTRGRRVEPSSALARPYVLRDKLWKCFLCVCAPP